ncbi:MAG: hypothetical protein ACP5GX_01910 [Anaerolineae bacterium]
MNTFNRVVIVVVLLVLIPLVSVLFVLPHNILFNVGTWMVNLGESLSQVQNVVRIVVGVILALLFDLLALFLVYLEVRRKRSRFIRVQEMSGGMATLSVDSIVQQLEYRIDPMPKVITVKPSVRAKGNKVKATVDVTVSPGGNVPQMAAKLVDTVEEVLVSDLGLQTAGDPEIRMKVAPPPRGKKPDREEPERRLAPSRPSTPPQRPEPQKPLAWGKAEPKEGGEQAEVEDEKKEESAE